MEEEVGDEEEEGSFYEDYQTGEFASYEFRLEDEQEKSRVSKSGIPVPRSKESPHAPTRAGLSLSLTFGTSSKGLSLRARRLRDLSGSGTDVGLGGSERGVFHSSEGERIEDGALSLDGRGRRESSVAQRIFSGGGDDGVGARAGSSGASAAVVAAFAAAAAATGGMLAQPPPPDTPPPKRVLAIIVPPGLKQTAAAASGVPYGSFHISGYGREEAAVGAATAAGSPRVETSRGTSGASAPHDVLHVSSHGGPGDSVGNEEDNDDITIVLGESVRCHAGLGGRHDCNGDVDEGINTERAGEITGGVRQGLVWNLEPGMSSSPDRRNRPAEAEEYDSFTNRRIATGGGVAITQEYDHSGSTASGCVLPSGIGMALAGSGGKIGRDLNMSSGRGGAALSALFHSMPSNSSELDEG